MEWGILLLRLDTYMTALGCDFLNKSEGPMNTPSVTLTTSSFKRQQVWKEKENIENASSYEKKKTEVSIQHQQQK